MKLKIVHLNQENRGGGEERRMKEEAVEMGMEEAGVRDPPVQDSVKEGSAEPVSDSHPLLVSGKRKRKPRKELIDEVSSIIMRKRKKSSSFMKPNDGTTDSGGTSRRSKVVANGGGPKSAVQMKSPTMIRAEEFLLSLSNDQPSILKELVRSHVGSCFWMGLPTSFCRIHLPGIDTEVILENENGEEFPIKYIANKTGLSAGWRKFVAGNKLIEGDALIFQLTGHCKFKVYIIRANDLTEVDGALSLLILDSQTKQNAAGGNMDAQSRKRRHLKSLPLMAVQQKKKKAGPVPQFELPEEQSGNDSDEVASEVLEGTKFSGSSLSLEDVKSFEEFHIVVNGACIDSDLPENIRRKYYDLCYTKGSFLHDRLLPGLYSKLAAGMIVETINIVDFIRGCKVTTPRRDLEVWEKSLSSFELLGLNVGFLRSRVHQLLRLAFEAEGASEIRRYREVQEEQSRTRDEIQKLEAKLVELREFSALCDQEIENLRSKIQVCELRFQEEVDAPW